MFSHFYNFLFSTLIITGSPTNYFINPIIIFNSSLINPSSTLSYLTLTKDKTRLMINNLILHHQAFIITVNDTSKLNKAITNSLQIPK